MYISRREINSINMIIGNGGSVPFYHKIAHGHIPGAYPFLAYGEVTTAGAASGVLWPNGVFDIPPAAGIQMEIVSSSANDTSGGTGINTMHVHVLRTDLSIDTFTITLNGLTPVPTTFTDIQFVQCMHLATVGSGGVAAGNISLQAVGGGQVYSYIAAGDKRCSSSARMVPKGKHLYVDGAVAGSASSTSDTWALIRISSTQFEEHEYLDPFILIPQASLVFQNSSFGLPFPIPFPFTEGNVVAMEYVVNKGAIVTGTFFGHIENA